MKAFSPVCLRTARLFLRPIEVRDAPIIARLAGDRRVADMTGRIPHPYSLVDALRWIDEVKDAWSTGEKATFVIERSSDHQIVGVISISGESHAEVGYWIGVPYWGKGYATEALREIVRHAFMAHGVEDIEAGHFPDNPASGRVMEKVGMLLRGVEPGALRRAGGSHDKVIYGISAKAWSHAISHKAVAA